MTRPSLRKAMPSKSLKTGTSSTVDANPTEAERTALRDKVSTRAIDGYLWLTDDAIAARQITWYGREMMPVSATRSWLSETDQPRRRSSSSSPEAAVTAAQADQTAPAGQGASRCASNVGARPRVAAPLASSKSSSWSCCCTWLCSFYGISVMRSVLEEKNSRASSKCCFLPRVRPQLMAGKHSRCWRRRTHADCGAWAVMAGVVALPRSAMQPSLSELEISPWVMACVCAVLPSRLPALQHDVRDDWSHHHDRARGPAASVPDRDSACPLGVHAHAGHSHTRLRRSCLDVNGPILRAHPDVRPNRRADAAAMADPAFCWFC